MIGFDNETSDSYTQAISLKESSSNYAMENWIVSSDGYLYEIIGPSLSDFKRYQSSIKMNDLSVYGSFAYKGYVYFIIDNNSLMRINYALKKIEALEYKIKYD